MPYPEKNRAIPSAGKGSAVDERIAREWEAFPASASGLDSDNSFVLQIKLLQSKHSSGKPWVATIFFL